MLDSGLPKGLRIVGVVDRFVDAELGSAKTGGGLANAVFVEEVLHDLQAAAFAAEDRLVRHPHVRE